jgi:hypothetical protein
MKKSKIEITQSEAQEIGRMLMNYGLLLDILSATRGIPSATADFIERRRRTDFQKANLKFERLMIKWCSAITNDKDKEL